MERCILSPRTEIFSGKRVFLKGSPKFPNGISKRKMCLPFCHSKPVPGHTPFFDLRHVGSVNMAASESSVFQCARTSNVVLVIRKHDLNSAIA